MAIDLDSYRYVLGLWLDTGDEGSKYWLSVLTELRNRGVLDVLIVCCDCDDGGVLLRSAA